VVSVDSEDNHFLCEKAVRLEGLDAALRQDLYGFGPRAPSSFPAY
jgi:hypothetical protein